MKRKLSKTVLDEVKSDKLKFIANFESNDHDKMENAIVKYYRKQRRINWNGAEIAPPLSWEGLKDLFGLAYTSSSSHASYWVCNGELKHRDTYNVIGFSIARDGKCYGLAWDDTEKETTFELK